MGKIFITDEVNDSYTARVTSTGSLRVNGSNNLFVKVASAASSGSTVVSSSPCWLKGVVIGNQPATASTFHIYDAASSAASATTTGLIGKMALAIASIGVSAATDNFPRYIDFGCYCASGLAYGVGQDGTPGNHDGITLIYRT